ncbi:hypothetical protein OVV29_33905, partial [Klebsiella pneumoniae]|nr:hypothetical protein [Klebsiella pneumoniae]
LEEQFGKLVSGGAQGGNKSLLVRLVGYTPSQRLAQGDIRTVLDIADHPPWIVGDAVENQNDAAASTSGGGAEAVMHQRASGEYTAQRSLGIGHLDHRWV